MVEIILLFWRVGLVPDGSFQLSGKLTGKGRPASQRGLCRLTREFRPHAKVGSRLSRQHNTSPLFIFGAFSIRGNPV